MTHPRADAPNVSIHRASPDEQREAYRNVHEVWGDDLSLDDFVTWRLGSVQHNRADWWVLTEPPATDVRASLGVYPQAFWLRGERVRGIGIGAVHTRPDMRGRGLADRLCRHVLRASADNGARVALLFSEIDPAYYQRMGFALCPHTTYSVEDDDLRALADSAPALPLAQLDPASDLPAIARAYRSWAKAQPVALARDAAYWRYSLVKTPNAIFLRTSPRGAPLSYIRVDRDGESYDLLEAVPSLRDQPEPARLLATLAQRTFASDNTLFTAWDPPPAALIDRFEHTTRDGSVPMVAPLGAPADAAWADTAAGGVFLAPDHF